MVNFLSDINALSAPYANGWMHVQGPGGNTSVKADSLMAIKASGYEFKNVVDGKGIVLTNCFDIADLLAKTYADNAFESTLPVVLDSIPAGLRPSMEFEFHAILDKYVLHTHSVIVNIVSCCSNAKELLDTIFSDVHFTFIDYFMPGHPLSAAIFSEKKVGNITPIIFLKNHGIIIHAQSISAVIATYQLVEDRIKKYFGLNDASFSFLQTNEEDIIHLADNYSISLQLPNIKSLQINANVLVPDQSIFFKNKVSYIDPIAPIYISSNDDVIIQGNLKFVHSALAMLKMVYFIAKAHLDFNLHSNYITDNELAKLHGLSSENYRLSIL
jgi:rhamnose utilization protein RhaD (predicted bifunctional aldolase and dehydrogenase)